MDPIADFFLGQPPDHPPGNFDSLLQGLPLGRTG
jgi:hypothetical protein